MQLRHPQLLAIVAAATACAIPPPEQLQLDPAAGCTVVPGTMPPIRVRADGTRCARPLSGDPVHVVLDAGAGGPASAATEAIRKGILIALEDVNAAGGVLKERPLTLQPPEGEPGAALGPEGLRKLAKDGDLVAVFAGGSGARTLEIVPAIHELGIPLLDPWSAADAVVENGRTPSWAFRLSLRDGWVMPVLLGHARALGTRRVGMLLPDSDWGRGRLEEAERVDAGDPSLRIVGIQWFDRGAASLLERYRALRDAGAQAVVVAAADGEVAVLAREVAALPVFERLPIIADWGAADGALAQLAGAELRKVELSVVQTYGFVASGDEAARRVAAAHDRLFKGAGARAIALPAAVAQAYDLTQVLARAINAAGSTDRRAVRAALERLGPYSGLIRTYAPPFTPERHEALAPEQLFMAEYAPDGVLEPIRTPRRRTLPD